MKEISTFRCLEVTGDRAQEALPIEQKIVQRSGVQAAGELAGPELPGSVLVRITHSSVNYKDALAATGHPGVAKSLPLVPGIDAAGFVQHSLAAEWSLGQRVLISAEAFGTSADGAWREWAWVPGEWLIAAPDGLSNQQICALGTAGITAAWCVDALVQHGVTEHELPVVVTGATGGVGSFAIEILSKKLGHSVVAVSGKTEQHAWLQQLGAQRVIPRDEFCDHSHRPLLSARFAGGVDTLGSVALSSMLRSVTDGGCVAACGLAAGPDLNLTVYPFILRGAILYGIDCTRYSQQQKAVMWQRLASDWFPADLVNQAKTITLEEVPEAVFSLIDGTNAGRFVVEISNE